MILCTAHPKSISHLHEFYKNIDKSNPADRIHTLHATIRRFNYLYNAKAEERRK